jgi:hypothetical protein
MGTRQARRAQQRQARGPFAFHTREIETPVAVALPIVFVSAATYSLLSQMIQVNVDKGIAMSVALTALSAVSLSSVCSRTVVGAMLDRTFTPVLAAAIFVFIATGVTLLNYTRAAWGIYLTPLLVGVGLGRRSLPSPHKYSVDHLSDSP